MHGIGIAPGATNGCGPLKHMTFLIINDAQLYAEASILAQYVMSVTDPLLQRYLYFGIAPRHHESAQYAAHKFLGGFSRVHAPRL